MLNKQVVEYREYPQFIVTFDGTEYILLKDFCAMTGLRPDEVTASNEAQGQIIEQPPTGRQRKPRQYITVKTWLALYERVFRLWLAERSTGSEYDDLVDYDDDGVETRKPWHWYGLAKITKMFDLDYSQVADWLTNSGFVTGSFADSRLPLTVQEWWANDKAKATGWIHNHMREPSPCGKWHIFIMLNVLHPEFAKLLAKLNGWGEKNAAWHIRMVLREEAEIRDIKWRVRSRMRREELPTSALVEAYERIETFTLSI